ncbi:MAG TPA: cytochrome b/b6 domain-containing protein [Xanthobacteraceae bacterium]|jgi:thiosulfate reductase cytochrome b subunit|nr:cytochrome b/b6 domain-containing protein [Xanthobacteraceae bacterium]
MTLDERGYVKVHPAVVRATHWLNVVAMAIMIGSGWRIWNSSPIFDFSFPVAVTLGGDPALSQDTHNELGLAGALQWHFAGMWLLVLNGLIYVSYGVVSGHFRHALFPVGPAAFVRDALAALTFRLPHRLGVYNAVQKTLYLGVIAAGILMVLSGLAIWKPGQFQELAWLFGGFDTARLVHFLGMAAIVLFLVIHISLVILVPKTLPAMITGRAAAHEAEPQPVPGRSA